MADTHAKKQSKTEALSGEPIPRLVLRFTASTLIALLLNSVYILIDALFVSWGVGDNAMGGISVVFPFVVLQGAISTAVGSGAASIVSRKLGEGRNGEAGEVTLNAMLTFYISAVITTVLGFILLDPLLKAMGVTGELYPYAKQFFIIILASNIFSTGFSSIIRAEGKMLYGLLIWVIPITINIILDAVFILGFGWGVRGSAAATVICQVTSFLMSLLFFTHFTSQNFKGARWKLKQAVEVLGTGLPSLVQMGSLSVMSAILNNVLKETSGTLGVNTFSYISKIITFAVVPFTAVTQALAPIVGFNYGAGNRKRVKKTVMFCTFISLIYALLALTALESIPGGLLRVFTANGEIIALGSNGLRIIAAAFIFAPFPMLAGAVYQAMGKKLWALIMYAANLFFLIPAAFYMAGRYGINGVWWAYVAASAAAAVLVCIILLKTKPLAFSRHLWNNKTAE